MNQIKKSLLSRCSAIIGLILLFTACDLEMVVNESLDTSGLSKKEVVEGLKAALKVGTDTSVSQLSKVNGYLGNALVKILIPDDVKSALDFADSLNDLTGGSIQGVLSALSLFPITFTEFDFEGFQSIRSDLERAMNRAAEEAAPKSVNIFYEAITGLSIDDGFRILNGSDTAATSYLKGRTYSPLKDEFKPLISSAISTVNADKIWNEFKTYYNQLAEYHLSLKNLADNFSGDVGIALLDMELEPIHTELDEYTTQKALTGLFLVVGEEETRIRQDPVARVSEILQKVFDTLDKE